jgi:biopolymer transport protein ExbD
MRVRKPEDESFEIMLIPMIDCMLVIIIFFLVATTLKNKQKELPLELPDASAALTVVQPPDVFVIGVDKTGQVFLGSDSFMEPVDNERLHRELRQLAQTAPARKVRIDADRNVRFEEVLRVMDLCTFEGVRNVGFHTRGEKAR